MIIRDTLTVELDLGAANVSPGESDESPWQEFEFDVEIQLNSEFVGGDCAATGRTIYYVDMIDCGLEGKNIETGEVLSFSPEILEILEDNFDGGKWITDYLENKREDSYDFSLTED